MRLEITDDLVEALVDPQDDTLVALRIPVVDRHVRELAGKLRDSGFDDTATRLEAAQERQTRLLALSIAERDEILAVLVDCGEWLCELRAAVLVPKHEWRVREGLG